MRQFVAEHFAAANQPAPGVVLHLSRPRGVGKHRLARAAADQLRLPLLVCDARRRTSHDHSAAAPHRRFKNGFGDFQTGNQTLAHAVIGFFLNGGTRCHVVRIDDVDAEIGDALDELAKIDEISLVAAPGARTQPAQEAIIDHCENLGDRFAILDCQVTTTIDVASIKGATKNSEYAALYFP